jgi:hypothetical protein
VQKTVIYAVVNLIALTALAQVEANPARPTVSTPATLTPVGYLQFETGALGAEASQEFSNQASINEVIKLAVAKRLQFLVVTQPFAVTDTGPKNSHDAGDISLGFQTVLVNGGERRPTLSVSYFRRVYSGTAPDIDIGSNRQSAILLLSADALGFHVDTNYIFNEQISDDAVHRAQFGQTLSISHPLPHKFTMGTELWHFTQPFSRSHAAGLLVAPSVAVKPNLVFDAGFNRGLTSTSTRWEVFAGFTYLLPKKLW